MAVPPVGRNHITQSVGWEVVKAGFTALYRSGVDLVRGATLYAVGGYGLNLPRALRAAGLRAISSN